MPERMILRIPSGPFPGTLFDVTALQAVRLLAELVQEHDGLSALQVSQLQESTDLTPEEINGILGRASELWDDIKSHLGHNAPAGQLNDLELTAFLSERMFAELL